MSLDTPEGAWVRLNSLRFGFATRRDFLGPITLDIHAGECWAVIGPNGAGKSTLLRLIAGLLTPDSGEIILRGTRLPLLSDRRRAKEITYLPQHPPHDLETTVRDVVLMGRFPHRAFGFFESSLDHRVAEQAMEFTGIQNHADRPINSLSGGEAQRVHLAAALAQATPILLLDEPTAALDLRHQLEIYGLLREIGGQRTRAVVLVSHDVNLAARFCSHVLLLHHGKALACGSPSEVVSPEVLEPVYGVGLHSWSAPGAPAAAGLYRKTIGNLRFEI